MKRTALTCTILAALIAPPAFAQAPAQDTATRLEQARAALAKAQYDLQKFEIEAKEEAERTQRVAAAARVAAEARAKAQAQQQQRDREREQAEALARARKPAPAENASDDDSFAMEPAPVQRVEIKAHSKYDPLRLKIVMRFPANVKTIQQATQYMLETVDYKLTLSPANPEETRMILSRPLLPQDKDGSLKTIEDGLLQISGDDTVLIIDRTNKLISFESDKNRK